MILLNLLKQQKVSIDLKCVALLSLVSVYQSVPSSELVPSYPIHFILCRASIRQPIDVSPAFLESLLCLKKTKLLELLNEVDDSSCGEVVIE